MTPLNALGWALLVYCVFAFWLAMVTTDYRGWHKNDREFFIFALTIPILPALAIFLILI